MSQKVLLNAKEVNIILHRLACQLIENHNDFTNTVLIGIQPRGKYLANRLAKMLKVDYKIKNIQLGYLDITFFRDDFRRGDKPLEANTTDIDFIIENKNVVFIDDVLYTGRTVRSGLDAVMDYGRPSKVELLTLIERRFSRHIPIRADYIGSSIDSLQSERVMVNWKENSEKDEVLLYTPKK